VTRWQHLDGFQQLAWLALARAVAEPEIAEFPPLQAFLSDEGNNSYNYLESLSMELAALVRPAWLSLDSGWGDVLRLAFHYLDLDNDGLLSAWDLEQHLVGQDSAKVANLWLTSWKSRDEGMTSPFSSAPRGLSFADFCGAMLVAAQESGLPLAAVDEAAVDEADGGTGAHSEWRAGEPFDDAAKLGSIIDAALEKRMHAIDEVCQRFLDEEFDDFGFGL